MIAEKAFQLAREKEHRIIDDLTPSLNLNTLSIICYHCKKAGHGVKKCWKLHPDLKLD